MVKNGFDETCQVFTLVMDKGQIVERGTHEQLIASNGLIVSCMKRSFEERGCNQKLGGFLGQGQSFLRKLIY